MKSHFSPLLAVVLLALGLILVAFYSYTFLVLNPYPGFEYNYQNGEIFTPYWDIAPLQEGDILVQVGEIRLEQFIDDLGLSWFAGYESGEVVPLRILRNGQELELEWTMQEPEIEEMRDRHYQVWFPYIFWFFALLTAVALRPRDQRWLLLMLFNLLTAAWLASGLASGGRVGYSAIMMRILIWLSVPVYLHLHWIFPWPLRRWPNWALILGYGSAVVLACLQFFQLLPNSSYYLGFLVAVIGSILLVFAHLFDRRQRRNDIALLLFIIGLGLAPQIFVSLAALLGEFTRFTTGGLLGLVALPLAYFYTAMRRQLGWLETPVNRAVGLLSFGVLLFSFSIPVIVVGEGFLGMTAAHVPFQVSLLSGIGLLSILFYPTYQRWFERRLLGIHWQAEHLKDIYAEQITTRLDLTSLVDLMQTQIMPSLLVRQSALLQTDGGNTSVVYASGVEPEELPGTCAEPALLAEAGRFRPASHMKANWPYPWVRLALPLRLGDQLVGLWLFGKRDPDDYYAAVEIETLKSLANQTSIALANITQSERLHALYQADITRQEAERQRLARELHDDVLHQMAILNMNASAGGDLAKFEAAYQTATDHIRTIMNNLRPAMLAYGLRAAIEQLADELPEVLNSSVAISIHLPESQLRYQPEVELQLYRIVQQACHNALQHAQPSRVIVSGDLSEAGVELVVADDGIGMRTPNALDLAHLVANQHFGLAGMVERAALIGAHLHIGANQPAGVRVEVRWQKPEFHQNKFHQNT